MMTMAGNNSNGRGKGACMCRCAPGKSKNKNKKKKRKHLYGATPGEGWRPQPSFNLSSSDAILHRVCMITCFSGLITCHAHLFQMVKKRF